MRGAGLAERLLGRALGLAGLAVVAACSQPPAPVVYGSARPAAVAEPAPAKAAAAALVVVPGGPYRVERGDTLYGIAQRFGLPARDIIDENGLQPPFLLTEGTVLRLPAARYHRVQRGDTLYGISRLYGVDLASLARANDLAEPYTIRLDARLRLPARSDDRRTVTATVLPPPPGIAAAPLATVMMPAPPLPRAKPLPGAAPPAAVAAAPLPPPTAAAPPPSAAPRPAIARPPSDAAPSQVPPAPPPRSAGRFEWPAQGRLISGFGPKGNGLHNDGINIELPRGAPVRAAENGIVAYAGNELKSYGNLVLLRHADGWVTAYAHADEVVVRLGDVVRRGQLIARAGSSGGVAEPQLHFEIRQGSRAVDPLRFLDRSAAALDGRPLSRS